MVRESLGGAAAQSSTHAQQQAASGFAVRMSLFYAAVFVLIGVNMPYFPVWLDWRGLSAREIGAVLAAPLIVRIVCIPAISFAADRLGNRRLVLKLLAWGALTCFALFLTARGFWSILAIAVLGAVFWSSVMPLTEAVAMDGVRRAGLDYGRMRLWGSLTFIAASFGGGLVLERWGAPSALWMILVAAACVAMAAQVLPRPSGTGRFRKAALPQIRFGDALRLARAPYFLLFLVTAGAVQATHAVYYAFGTLHWRAAGISAAVIGLLWATGVIAEVLLFTVSRRAVARFGPATLILLAAAAAVVRWTATGLSPPLWLLFPLQALHGATFGAAHLGAIHFISDAVPDEASGTAQGLYAAFTSGVAMGLAFAASGPLYAAFGGEAFLAMAVLAAAAGLGALALRRGWTGGHLITLNAT